MNEPEHTASETEQRLRRGEGDEVVVLQDGDPLEAPPEDAADWDWEADTVVEGRQCASCGACGPLFHMEDGSRVCAACAHGASSAP